VGKTEGLVKSSDVKRSEQGGLSVLIAYANLSRGASGKTKGEHQEKEIIHQEKNLTVMEEIKEEGGGGMPLGDFAKRKNCYEEALGNHELIKKKRCGDRG